MSRVTGNLYVSGSLSAGSFNLPAGAVDNAAVIAGAAITADKLQHSHRANYAQASGTTAAADTRVIYTVHGATGVIQAAKFGAITPAIGAATVTIDVKKNGTTVLTGTIGLSSAQAARALVAGTIAGAGTVVAGDVLEIVMTVAAGGGTLPLGVFGYVDIFEAAQ